MTPHVEVGQPPYFSLRCRTIREGLVNLLPLYEASVKLGEKPSISVTAAVYENNARTTTGTNPTEYIIALYRRNEFLPISVEDIEPSTDATVSPAKVEEADKSFDPYR